MPSYDYRCLKCKKQFSTILSIKQHDSKKAKCPKCGGKNLAQLISSFMVKTSRKS
jgi:putative FmdB family regulatory protein